MNQAVSFLELAALAFGLLSTILGGALWWRSIVRERYAAEREISHLQNAFKQMAENLHSLVENIDEYRGEVRAATDRLERAVNRVEAYISIRGDKQKPLS